MLCGLALPNAGVCIMVCWVNIYWANWLNKKKSWAHVSEKQWCLTKYWGCFWCFSCGSFAVVSVVFRLVLFLAQLCIFCALCCFLPCLWILFVLYCIFLFDITSLSRVAASPSLLSSPCCHPVNFFLLWGLLWLLKFLWVFTSFSS